MHGGGRRALALAFAVASIVATALLQLAPGIARADDNAQAAALFASGNQHLQAAARARGDRRAREAEAALADYVASLRIVRSRNVLFNASLALEILERHDDAFNYLAEYLAVPGLSEEEVQEATRRLDALRPRVATLAIRSTPAGAEVWLDRRDLAVRGRTPLEIAVSPGGHRLWLRARGHRESEAHAEATLGSASELEVTLAPEPVSLQVLAPAEPTLTLDGARITAGAHVEVSPGSHVLRLELEGARPLERRFEALPGAAPMVIDLGPAAASMVRRETATLVITTQPAARVLIDGLMVGGGTRVEAPVRTGEHEIRVEADRHRSYETRRAFSAGDHAELRVALVEDRASLTPVRIGVGVATGVALLGVLGTTIGAVVANDDYESCVRNPPFGRAECEARADDAESWGIAAYTTWGIAGALALIELGLLLADDGRDERSAGELVLAPVVIDGGVAVVAGGSL